jgi:hypothetical protein
MYSLGYTEKYHPLLGIRLKPSCEPVLSRLPACAVHRLRLSSSPQHGPQPAREFDRERFELLGIIKALPGPSAGPKFKQIPIQTNLWTEQWRAAAQLPLCCGSYLFRTAIHLIS